MALYSVMRAFRIVALLTGSVLVVLYVHESGLQVSVETRREGLNASNMALVVRMWQQVQELAASALLPLVAGKTGPYATML